MANELEKYTCGGKAEAIDDCGIWCRCTVIARAEHIVVSFDGWKDEWNREISDPSEIREVTTNPGGKRKRSNLSKQVRLYSVFPRNDRIYIDR